MKKLLIAIVLMAVVSVDAATLTVTSNADSGAGSFREVLSEACDGDTIRFNLPDGRNTITISYSLSMPYNTFKDLGLVVDGYNDGRGVTIKGGGTYSYFSVRDKVIISNMTFTACRQALYMNACTGGVYNCTFTNNRTFAGESGGAAIYSWLGSKMVVENCRFDSNYSYQSGGAALYTSGSNNDFEMINCEFKNNRVEQESADGGAIYCYGRLKLLGCVFENNRATGNYSEGGAVYHSGNDKGLEIDGCVFADNVAYDGGGAIRAHVDGIVRICNSVFKRNSTNDGYGGAIYKTGGRETYVENCLFEGNETAGGNAGGAICANSTLHVQNSTFLNNKSHGWAGNGGAIWGVDPSVIVNCAFIGNESEYHGAALYLPNFKDANSRTVVANCVIVNNKSGYAGGAMVANTDFINTIILGNTAGNNSLDFDGWNSPKSSLEYSIYGEGLTFW